ncbi:DegT/DnrJ/EryC1/StrS family aminotransferase [Novosphingobium gossypii]|uniref:DegT/DnrJ/EryC1/StrS family aminotransferase n=1 Tax=Novosphingobium gossypii TaxID=1604774 RepID=UPI003D241C18
MASSRRLLPCEPILPTADAIAPYLRLIDKARMYSNQGPLVRLLQQRMATLLSLPADTLVAASSGTAALTAAILAHAGEASTERPLALCPAYTFVATATAARHCGYEPYLADVSAQTWTLDPDQVTRHPMLARIGVVIPVSAYGRPLDVAAWSRFQQETSIPVVIDAAAAIEALATGTMRPEPNVPLALSFHATKAFGCGEGGCIVWSDPALAADARQATNFGFGDSRNSTAASLNGKMSEYHAAVALAELDGWAAKRAAFARAAQAYRAAAAREGLPADTLMAHPDVASAYILHRRRDARSAERLRVALDAANIEARLWYGHGLHRHDHLLNAPRDALPETERLAGAMLGLPMGCGLGAADIARVVAVLAANREEIAPETETLVRELSVQG